MLSSQLPPAVAKKLKNDAEIGHKTIKRASVADDAVALLAIGPAAPGPPRRTGGHLLAIAGRQSRQKSLNGFADSAGAVWSAWPR